MSEKIQSSHLKRKAILYVRQSSMYQVLHNEESRRLQYAMDRRLREYGWQEIEVIDEDLGRSAAGMVERVGFQRMVTEVCLRKVGVVAAREVSRFARNSRDWQQLIEVCRLVDTLLLDHETVYDTRNSNDRLLLGLKGSLNEYELDLLRQRSLQARQEKAQRGELLITAPIGYQKSSDGRLEKDPDARVQRALLLVYEKFLELGTVRQTLMWFIEEGLEFPTTHPGPAGWRTVWKRPSYRALYSILRNPIYAGAYAYGKTEASSRLDGGQLRKAQRHRPMENWPVLIRDHHEGYITWEEFERLAEMISKNAQRFHGTSPGAPREGTALLGGLLRCRRCGRKMFVRYTGQAHTAVRYICGRGRLDQGEDKCITFGGTWADEAVSSETLRVVRPGAIEAARQAGQEDLGRQDQVIETLALELKAARYESERAARQYDAAEPENRLVVDELETRWNAALERVREVEQRFDAAQRLRLSLATPSQEVFQDLAANLESVWFDPSTDVRLKKRILRTLIEEIVADVDQAVAEVVLVIHWKGGLHTELRVRRRRRGECRTHTPTDIIETVRSLALVSSDLVIAGALTRHGLRTGRGNRWTEERVRTLRCRHGIPALSSTQLESEGWMNLSRGASYLGVTSKTLRRAAERGKVSAIHPLAHGPWIFKQADLDAPQVQRDIRGLQTEDNDPAGPRLTQLTLDLPNT